MYKYVAKKVNGKKIDEHRLVAAEKFGASKIAGMVIHHINGNKRDNRPENLELMTRSEHARQHSKGIKRTEAQNKATGIALRKYYTVHTDPRSKQILRLTKEGVPVERFKSIKTVIAYGYREQRVSDCCNGKRLHHKNSIWVFMDALPKALQLAYSRTPLHSRSFSEGSPNGMATGC